MHKIKVGLVTNVIDGRRAHGTALVSHRFLEQLDRFTDEFEFTLIHNKKDGDPLYKKYPELLMPKVALPFADHMLRESAFWLRQRLRGERFDIVHYLNPRVWPSYLLANTDHVIVTAYDAGVMIDLHPHGLPDRAFQFTNRFLHFRMDRVIGVSQFAKREIAGKYHMPHERVLGIYCAIDQTFKPSNRTDRLAHLQEKYGIPAPYILSVGRLDPHKNILALVEAFAIARKESFSYHLVLVGGRHMPEYSRQVEERIQALGIGEQVYIAPYIEEADLPDLYAEARAAIFPSLHEGFGLPVLEAFACNTPIAVANATSLPEVAGDGALLFDPHDPKDAAKALREIVSDETLRADLIAKGAKRVHDFSWSTMADEIIATYRSVMTQKKD